MLIVNAILAFMFGLAVWVVGAPAWGALATAVIAFQLERIFDAVVERWR